LLIHNISIGNPVPKDQIFAVLIDGENVSSSLLGSILDEVEKYGVAAVRKVYGDWTKPTLSSWMDNLHNYSFRPEQQFHYGKDAADHALIMDAIELISTNKRINAVCVVSSDGGFYSLAQRIRERGLHMMGIGRRDTPDRFIKACLNFVYIDNLETNIPNENIKEADDIESLLMRAYLDCAESNEPVHLGSYGKRLKMIDSAFDPRTYGHATLKKMVKNHPQLFTIENESIDQCYIRLIPSERKKPPLMKGIVKRWLGHYGFIESDNSSWYFYIGNINSDQREKIKVKSGMPVEFTAVKHPNLDATETAEKNGKADEIRFL